jgi:hypothetical protein
MKGINKMVSIKNTDFFVYTVVLELKERKKRRRQKGLQFI